MLTNIRLRSKVATNTNVLSYFMVALVTIKVTTALLSNIRLGRKVAEIYQRSSLL